MNLEYKTTSNISLIHIYYAFALLHITIINAKRCMQRYTMVPFFFNIIFMKPPENQSHREEGRIHAFMKMHPQVRAIIAPRLTSPDSARSRRRSLCTYALSATRVSMITQVCIRVPLPLLRVIRDFCVVPSTERNSEGRWYVVKHSATNV
jgi:hypothetical protein